MYFCICIAICSVVGSAVDRQYYKDIQPWRMDSLPVSVKEDNDHYGLILSGYMEEENNIDNKIKKAHGSLFKLMGPAFSAKCLVSPVVQLHLFRTYICPVARSGLSGMALRTDHINPLSPFHKKIIRGFLYLSDRAPVPSLNFLTGELPECIGMCFLYSTTSVVTLSQSSQSWIIFLRTFHKTATHGQDTLPTWPPCMTLKTHLNQSVEILQKNT